MLRRKTMALAVLTAAALIQPAGGQASDLDSVEARSMTVAQGPAGNPAAVMSGDGPRRLSAPLPSASRAARSAATRTGEPISLERPDSGAPLTELTVGATRRIALNQPITDVIVASPKVADVVVRDPRNVFLVGRGPGKTSVFLVGRDGQVVRELDVLVNIDLDGARQALRKYLPDADITLEPVGDGVLMMGWVRSAQEAAGAQSVVQAYLSSASVQENTTAPAEGGEEGEDAGGEASPFADMLGQSSGQSSSGGGEETINVINALRVAGDQQVLLQVRVAEMQRTTLKRLGVNVYGDTTNPRSLSTDFGLQGSGPPTAGASTQAGVVGSALLPSVIGPRVEGVLRIGRWGIDAATFRVLERQGLVKVLAEPALTAINGETANFLAGGEFPAPTRTDSNGNTQIEFKPFGVGLSFTPVVLANDQLSIRIATEVSRVSEENGLDFTLAGGTLRIQGLSVRRAESTVMLPSGGSLMIAGLIENNEFNEFNGVPGLMDLPILGALFRSQEFQANRTELVVIIQAFLVRPVDFASQLALPTDGFVPASDLDIYVMGKLFHSYGDPTDPARERLSVAGPLGYIME